MAHGQWGFAEAGSQEADGERRWRPEGSGPEATVPTSCAIQFDCQRAFPRAEARPDSEKLRFFRKGVPSQSVPPKKDGGGNLPVCPSLSPRLVPHAGERLRLRGPREREIGRQRMALVKNRRTPILIVVSRWYSVIGSVINRRVRRLCIVLKTLSPGKPGRAEDTSLSLILTVSPREKDGGREARENEEPNCPSPCPFPPRRGDEPRLEKCDHFWEVKL